MLNRRTLIGSSLIPIRFVFFMWLVFVLQFVYGLKVEEFGLLPRTLTGAIGIATSPFVHADPIHLISNTIPLLFLGITLFYYYPRNAKKVFLASYLLTNLLVWIFARPELHIGASGIVYSLATFCITFGLFRRDFKSLIISIIVVSLYGFIYTGLLDTSDHISWESHLIGACIGLITAFVFRKEKA